MSRVCRIMRRMSNEEPEGGWHEEDDEGGTERTWRCGRCATVNAERDSICHGCGLPKEASVWE